MSDPVQALNEAVQRMTEARAALVEQACEKALQGGLWGVAIYRDEAGDEWVGPHPAVPYGQIYEYRGLPPWLS